jgi:redox-sensitive bicupin YhaK (pirin superfamily)
LIELGTKIQPQASQVGPDFRAMRYVPAGAGALADPILYLAHFSMTGPAFGPHPHAGFSAITYLFRDSQTGFRNRDSLGNDEEIAPGGLLWTCAGGGILHDEEPLKRGRIAHGLQIFLNLPEHAQAAPPKIFRLAGGVAQPADRDGNEILLLDGNADGAPQDFRLWDLSLTEGTVDLPIQGGAGGLVVVLDGAVSVSVSAEAARPLAAPHAFPFMAGPSGGMLTLSASSAAKAVVMTAQALDQPVHWHGPFAMARASDIPDRVRAYHAGLMGRLDPLPVDTKP